MKIQSSSVQPSRPQPSSSRPATAETSARRSGTGTQSTSDFTPARPPAPATLKMAPAFAAGKGATSGSNSGATTAEGLKMAPAASVTRDSRFSEDFRSWLNSHGYGKYDFAKGDLPSFGGRAAPGEKLTNEPVIFIHGNGGTAADWNNSVQYFAQKGYKPSEMYGMTWGSGNIADVGFNTHTKKFETEVRAFIQAVKEYTGADKVDIVSHSMGVTLARKAVEGGPGEGSDGKYNLGKPLTDSVDTFVGIAGANRGLTSTFELPNVPAANRIDGFFPGYLTPFGVVGQSKILQDINSKQHYEGQHVYSIWSPVDEVVNAGAPFGGGLVYGVPTSEIPAEDGEKIYATYGHFGLKDLTADEQYKMVHDHQT